MNMNSLLLGACGIIVAGATQAATYTFDMTANGYTGYVSGFTASATEDSDVTVNVTGGVFDAVTNTVNEGAASVATWTGHGLGACNWVRDGSCKESHQVDGYGRNEVAIFDFGAMDVTLQEIEFGYVGDTLETETAVKKICKWTYYGYRCYKKSYTVYGDVIDEQFELFVDDGGILTFVDSNTFANDTDGTVESFAFDGELTASRFGVGARGDYDAFKIRSITVTKNTDTPGGPTLPPVPLPAGGVLLLTGLGALAAARRARKT